MRSLAFVIHHKSCARNHQSLKLGLKFTLPVGPCISGSCIKIKIIWNFYFDPSLWCLKSFYEVFNPLIKRFEARQRSVKIKFKVNFWSPSGIGKGRIEYINKSNSNLIVTCDFVIGNYCYSYSNRNFYSSL